MTFDDYKKKKMKDPEFRFWVKLGNEIEKTTNEYFGKPKHTIKEESKRLDFEYEISVLLKKHFKKWETLQKK